MDDAIGDTEKLRDRLLPITFGVWDYYKNSGRFDSKNWELEWVGFLPGKRESRRYVGAHILTQNEVRDGGRFDDLIAYGGWSMDDHHPAGFDTTEAPTILPSGSFAVRNSLSVPVFEEYRESVFSGRNISCTHTAMSSCRVMATCATLGQAMEPRRLSRSERASTRRGLREGICR